MLHRFNGAVCQLVHTLTTEIQSDRAAHLSSQRGIHGMHTTSGRGFTIRSLTALPPSLYLFWSSPISLFWQDFLCGLPQPMLLVTRKKTCIARLQWRGCTVGRHVQHTHVTHTKPWMGGGTDWGFPCVLLKNHNSDSLCNCYFLYEDSLVNLNVQLCLEVLYTAHATLWEFKFLVFKQ